MLPWMLVLMLADGLPFFDSRELTPYWPDAPTKFQAAQVTPFKAVDQDGQTITESQLKEGFSLVNFFFAECPGICPVMMQSLKKFQKNLGPLQSKVRIYSFSVQPDRDKPENLRAYAKSQQIASKEWKLLTGDRRIIYHVGKDMFKADGAVGDQKSEDAFIHTQNAYLLDKDLRVRGIYDTGSGEAMQLLVKDIDVLVREEEKSR